MEASAKQIHEHQVLQHELKSLRKNAAVYKQQQNSQIFFKTNVDKVMADSKRTLDGLVAEYQSAEAMSEPGDTQGQDG